MSDEPDDEWPEYRIDTPAVRAAAAAIAQLYVYFPTGGYLHIVTDDDNVEDANLDWCGQQVDENKYGDSEGALKLHRAVIAALKPLDEAERMSANALVHGNWKIPGFELKPDLWLLESES